jgi:prevent-host-death family protein
MAKIIGVTKLQREFRSVFDEVVRQHIPYILTRGSRPEAVLIPYDQYVRLMRADEAGVLKRFDALLERTARVNAGYSEDEVGGRPARSDKIIGRGNGNMGGICFVPCDTNSLILRTQVEPRTTGQPYPIRLVVALCNRLCRPGIKVCHGTRMFGVFPMICTSAFSGWRDPEPFAQCPSVTLLYQALQEEESRKRQGKLLADIRRRRFALPPRAPDSVELLREDRRR